MSNRLQKGIYYLSAASPILIVSAIVWIIKKSSWTDPVSISWEIPALLLAISALSIAAFIVSFQFGKRNLQIITVNGTNISNGDGWIVAFAGTYLIPLLSFPFGESSGVTVSIAAAVLMLTVLTFTDYVTPHPLLYLCNYHFYRLDVEGAQSDYCLISKKQLKHAADVKSVSQIFDGLLLRRG